MYHVLLLDGPCIMCYCWIVCVSCATVGWSVYHVLRLDGPCTMCCPCFQCYMEQMLSPDKELPAGISGKHNIIFGNLQEIYDFHNKWVVM